MTGSSAIYNVKEIFCNVWMYEKDITNNWSVLGEHRLTSWNPRNRAVVSTFCLTVVWLLFVYL